MNGNSKSSFRLFCICLIAATVGGCGKKQSPPAPPSQAKAKALEIQKNPETNQPIDAVSMIEAEDSGPTISSVSPQTTASPEVPDHHPRVAEPPEAETLASESSQPAPARPELRDKPMRVYLPTAAGPLIVDVHIHIDQKNQHDLFQEEIGKVIADASTDTDEPLGWTQLFSFVRDNPERFGPIMQNVGNQTRELIRRYDRNRNQRVDHDEVARFLFRESRENVAFRVRGTEYYRNNQLSQTSLFSLLDENRDGALGANEIDHLDVKLLRFDRNSDRQLELNEVQSKIPGDDEVWGRKNSERHGDVAMDLEGFVDWNLVCYSLDSQRDRKPFGTATNVIVSLDDNEDGTTSPDEASHLLEISPHLHFRIQFKPRGEPQLRIVSRDPRMEDGTRTEQHHATHLVLADEELQLSVRVIDQPGRRERLPVWAYQVRGRAVEFPDALFGWLDRNQDGRLSTREINSASAHLGRLFDQNTVVRRSSLPTTYTLTFVRGNPDQDGNSFRRPVATKPVDPAPDWAKQMDTNDDGEISRHEFIGTRDQFDELDGNKDGFLEASEVAD